MTILHEVNTARDKVFVENKIGTQGFLPIMLLFGTSVVWLSFVSAFRRRFPRLAGLAGDSIWTKGIFFYICLTAGRSMEQYVIEHEVQADKYKEYLKKADYYEELKSRKLATLPI